MKEIGIRELKAELSGLLRLVEDGEQVRVTRHGTPVADIVPTRSSRGDERIRELVATGRLTPAGRARPRRRPRPLRTAHSASELVLAERDEER